MSKSVHIKTFGCQMNVYDSDRMKAVLSEKGYSLSEELRGADVVLLNTCSIRDKSENKVLTLLGQLKPLKDANPAMVIGVSGCLGQRMGRELLQRVPHLDLVFGPDSVTRVGELIDSVVNQGKRVVEAKFDDGGRLYSEPAKILNARPVEFLTIIKGCDHFCTYCIVPFVRGREKSRAIPEILEDVRNVIHRGTKEITFLGQNINTYGKGTPHTLAQLIEQTNEIPGVERIRYLTSHPRDLGQDLIEQFGRVEKLCPQLHLPFQSGNDRVLKRMSRLYTRADYLAKIDALRKHCPEISLSTDVIVGFPGETEEEFQDTLTVLRQVAFTQAYLFKYSPRPGTRAFAYEEEIPEAVKADRLARANAVLQEGIDRENAGFIGKRIPVLIEGLDKKKKYFSGRTPQWKLVHVMNAGEACQGKIIDVEITEGHASNLRGYYTGAPRVARGMEAHV